MPSKRISKHIDRLLVDPNNYRFRDLPDYKSVSEEKAADPQIQKRTLNFLRGPKNANIKDLIKSFTTNGFMDIDQIQVKALGDKFLVLEGNRRTATLKYLFDEFKKGNDVGKLEEGDFRSVNVVQIDEDDPVEHLVAMGLHHINGKRRWPPVNEAQLVEDLISIYNKSEEEVCDALGITKNKLRRSRRTLALIEQYKESDYGDQFETNKYTIFETVVSNPTMKNWIDWDDYHYKANNGENLERLFSWISQTEESEDDQDGYERTTTAEPIITQYRQIKDLADFVNDPQAVKRMEESRSVTEGYAYSSLIGENRLKAALNTMKSEVNQVFTFSEYLNEKEYQEIEKLQDKLDRLIPSSRALMSIADKKLQNYFTDVANHFSNISVVAYRKLQVIQLKKLNRVNIIVGGNNMGKTTLLESIYLLSQLNDMNALLSLEKYRGKFYEQLPAKWIDKGVTSAEIEGVFNGANVEINLLKEETAENIDKSGYLSTIKAEAKVENTEFHSQLHLFGQIPAELKYQKVQVLCPATFTSPYRYNQDLLIKAHAHAIREKHFDSIITFLQKYLDSEIEKIEMISDDGESRFMVSTANMEDAIDITKYGEGLQRIFEIALFMVYSENGIMCIDEIDSAIHKNLLIEFTKFIQEMAEEFNVQVFLTTHSKECIDAFVENKYANDKLMAYALTDKNGQVKCKYIDGERLETLVESIDFDIR